jgi:hypothetical protein
MLCTITLGAPPVASRAQDLWTDRAGTDRLIVRETDSEAVPTTRSAREPGSLEAFPETLIAQASGAGGSESAEDPFFGGEGGEIDEDALFGGDGDGDNGTDEGEESAGADGNGSGTDGGSSTSGSVGAVGNDTATADDEAGSREGFTQEITEIEEGTGDFTDPFLTSQDIELGGDISAGIGTTFYWQRFPDSWDSFVNRWNESFSPTLEGSLFFDARPSIDFRVFGKAKARLPFTTSYSFYGVDEQSVGPGSIITTSGIDHPRASEVTISVPELTLFELFSDFNWDNTVFFRMGKQTVNWGVGYFFSPADIISLTPIDVEDPEAEREGPLALKANIPIDIHNIDLYLISGSTIDSITEIGLAGRGQVVVGPFEIGVGIGWQKSRPFKSTLTFTLPIEDFSFFGEALLSIGSERTFIERTDDGTYTLTTYDEQPFFSATAGGMYRNTDAHLNIMAQYYFNHQGYADPGIVSEFYKDALEGFETVQTQPLSVTREQASAMSTFEDISLEDLRQAGRHYTALSVSWYDIADSGVGLSGFWMGGFSDLSGRMTATLSYGFTDYVKVSGSAHIAYGEEGDEFIGIEAADRYVNVMNPYGRLGFTISATVGSGSF